MTTLALLLDCHTNWVEIANNQSIYPIKWEFIAGVTLRLNYASLFDFRTEVKVSNVEKYRYVIN